MEYAFTNSLCHCSISCICVCFSELVPVFMAMPVCLFEVSEQSTECLSSIGEILVTSGLAYLSKEYLQFVPEYFSVESMYRERINSFTPLAIHSQIYYAVCSRVSAKKSLPLEHTVWDPPLVEEGPSQSEPMLPTLDPMAIQPSLTLPACLKDLKVKVTHVTSPGNICMQLLQFDTQLKRYQPHLNKIIE